MRLFLRAAVPTASSWNSAHHATFGTAVRRSCGCGARRSKIPQGVEQLFGPRSTRVGIFLRLFRQGDVVQWIFSDCRDTILTRRRGHEGMFHHPFITVMAYSPFGMSTFLSSDRST